MMSEKQGMIRAAERLEQMAKQYDVLNAQENALANELLGAASIIRQEANAYQSTKAYKSIKKNTSISSKKPYLEMTTSELNEEINIIKANVLMKTMSDKALTKEERDAASSEYMRMSLKDSSDKNSIVEETINEPK